MKLCVALLVVLSTFPDTLLAATEYATFESFYKEPSTVGWILAGVVALIAGAVIVFTAAAASPIVIGIGSWIGGMMGLSGIAATNTGLALLGGGSIASGGFGIIGGTALLTAALSFGTDIVFDYTIGKAVSAYKYSNLTEHSKKMPTLPLPINDSGPDAYESAMEVLKGINEELPIYSTYNQKAIRRAITVLESSQDAPDIDEQAKNNSLLSLLNFVSNDYVKAKKFARLAISSARESEIKRTLPAFIYATSSLYEEDFDFISITKNYFRYSILAEPDNPLIPMLFSIYLDRMFLRFNDGYLDEKSLNSIFNIMQLPSIVDYRVLNYTVLLSRYFIRLKLEQQKIASLSNSSNETIKNSPKTLAVMLNALERYDTLTNGAKDVTSHFLVLELNREDRIKATEFHDLLISYIQEREKLSTLIDELRKYQDNLSEDKIAAAHELSDNNGTWVLYILLMLFVVSGLVLIKKAHSKNKYSNEGKK